MERDFTIGGQKTCDGCYGEVHYDDVRVPATSLLGERNGARAVAETRGDAGHLHYAMRAIGQLRLVIELMCERAKTFGTRWGPLGSFQLTRKKIADSWIEMEQLRLLLMHTAMLIDQGVAKEEERKYVAAVKARCPASCTMSWAGACICTARSVFPARCRSTSGSPGRKRSPCPTGQPRCTSLRWPRNSWGMGSRCGMSGRNGMYRSGRRMVSGC